MAAKTTQWILEMVDRMSGPFISAANNADEAARQIGELTAAVGKLGQQSTEIGTKFEKFGKNMFFMNEVADSFQRLNTEFVSAIDPGVKFQSALADMQAITMQTDQVISALGNKARDLAPAFGQDAATAVDVFKVYLSKLTPELVKSPDALSIMATNALTLSKTMGNDLAGATDVLTTAMNQFQISTEDPIKAANTMTGMMNIMAAGAAEGSAEMMQIKEALEQTGMMAKMANVSFVETNAAIQVLDKLGKTGSEGGVALRNVLTTLAQGRFLPKDVLESLKDAGVSVSSLTDKSKTLSERLQSLKPIMQDDALMTKLFTRENSVSALALLSNIPLLDQYTSAINGTNTAVDQSRIVMNTYAEEMAAHRKRIDDYKISFFQLTEPIAPYMEMLGALMEKIVMVGMTIFSFSQIMNVGFVQAIGRGVMSFGSLVAGIVTGSTTITAAISAIPIVGWIVGAITAIGALVAYFYQTSGEFRAFLWGTWEAIKATFVNVGKFIADTFIQVNDIIIHALDPRTWFNDDYSFADAFTKIADGAVQAGKNIAQSFRTGYSAGMADFNAGKEEEAKGQPKKTDIFNLSPGGNTGGTVIPLVTAKEGKGTSLGGNGGGASAPRNVNMTVNFTNQFSVGGKTDVKTISDNIMQQITAVLRDSIIALD